MSGGNGGTGNGKLFHHMGQQAETVEPAVDMVENPTQDWVNNPAHYNQGEIECIEAIEAALTPEEFRGHCKANAIKYVWRERKKGGDESIRKAIWYLSRLVQGEGA